MPNVGRIVLVTSTVSAVVAAVGFAAVVTSRPDVDVGQGISWCMASTGSGTTVFGLYVENNDDHAVTLNSIEAGTTNHLASIGYSALPPRNPRSTALGVGVESYRDVANWSSRRPVAGAPVPAHSEVAIVIFPRLATDADSGNARDFTIRMTGFSGLQHALVSRTNVGFYPAGDSNMPDCDR